MKVTKSTPKWAIQLVEQVCKDYKRSTPSLLQWYNREGQTFSGGTTWRRGNKLHVSAGTNEYDQELVLLHELAHHLLNKKKQDGHSIKFWRLAFELYHKYGMDLGYAIYREEHYREKATWAYMEVLAKIK